MVLILAVVLVVFIVSMRSKARKSRPAKVSRTSKEVEPTPVREGSSEKTAETDAAGRQTDQRMAAAPGNFLCYRRMDSAEAAGRIYDRLVARFGKEAVFKDVDSIPLGVDFRSAIAKTIERCCVCMALIGPDWCDKEVSDDRLSDPRDHVRIEIEAALQRGIPSIPVLVRGAAMPTEGDFPAVLSDLTYRNGILVHADPDFNQDIVWLITGVEDHHSRH